MTPAKPDRPLRVLLYAAVVVLVSVVGGVAWYVHWARDDNVRHNLRMLHLVWMKYHDEHGGRAPTSMPDLFYEFQIPPDHVLVDPITGRPEVAAYETIDFPTTRPADEHAPMFVYQAGHRKCTVRFDGSTD